MVNYIENYLAYRKDNADLLTYISDKSVLKVARKLLRNFVGYEINKEYVEIAKKRLKNEI